MTSEGSAKLKFVCVWRPLIWRFVPSVFSLAMNRASTTKPKKPSPCPLRLLVACWKFATKHHVFNKWFLGPLCIVQDVVVRDTVAPGLFSLSPASSEKILRDRQPSLSLNLCVFCHSKAKRKLTWGMLLFRP